MTGSISRSAVGAAVGAVALSLALATAPSGAAAAARPADRCDAAGGRTVSANREARVYAVENEDEHTLLYGCTRPGGRPRLLADAFDDDYVSSSSFAQVRLRGHMVAFALTTYDISCKGNCPSDYQAERDLIEVVDLRRARVVRTVRGVLPLDLAVTTRGGVAWTQKADDGVEVRAADSWGRRVLDRGAIDARSLTSELTIVSWLHDGVERFSRLR